MLDVSGLSANYGHVAAVRDVSLRVDRKEAVAVLGANGAGKSTLLRALAGLHKDIRGGSVVLRGQEVIGLPAWKVARLGMGLCPQGRRCFGDLTAEENLLMGGLRIRPAQRLERMRGLLDLFPTLATRLKVRAKHLSGGEQQMVAIARALLGEPSLLLLDEPSLGLAPKVVESIGTALRNVVERELLSIVVVEQNLRLVEVLCERAYVLSAGECVMAGLVGEVRDRVESETLGT